MKCSHLLFGTLSLGVVVLVYLTTSAHCEESNETNNSENEGTIEIKPFHNLTMGQREPNDKVVLNQTIKKGKSNRFLKAFTFLEWPEDIDYEQVHIISKFVIEDTGNGGRVRVNDGGLGHPFIEIYFEAQAAQGLEYQVTIYAYPSY